MTLSQLLDAIAPYGGIGLLGVGMFFIVSKLLDRGFEMSLKIPARRR